jgi:fatty-acyl-CoA synthase
VRQFRDEKGVRFKQGFGMTEFGPGIFALAAEDAIEKAGSIGRPNFYVAARVVDDNNQPLGPNQVGELVLKGPSVSSGYFNNPEATAAASDAEGWFHTGDLAQYDEDGYFYIVDRKKDMFISGGENIYPAEIERVLYGHTAVHMCAVVGIPNEKWGEIGVACVVPKPNTALSRTTNPGPRPTFTRSPGPLQSAPPDSHLPGTTHFRGGQNPQARPAGRDA